MASRPRVVRTRSWRGAVIVDPSDRRLIVVEAPIRKKLRRNSGENNTKMSFEPLNPARISDDTKADEKMGMMDHADQTNWIGE